MMRRLLILLFFLFSLPAFASPARHAPLKIYTWVDYFPQWLTAAFTEETGIPVIQTFFADNKQLYRGIAVDKQMARFDLVTPSAEMVQQLIAENLLLPFDHKRVSNIRDIDPLFAAHAYDPGCRFSVPMFWGVLGILIDTRVVPEAVSAHIAGYADLWLPELKGKILLPNDLRSLMSVMLLKLGHSVNDTDSEHLNAAMSELESLAPSVIVFDTVDQVEYMSKTSVGVGVVWGKEEYGRKDPDSYWRFIFPKEGSPLWIDTLAVPTSSGNPEAAFLFINFVLRPENLAKLCQGSGYAVASAKAWKKIPAELLHNQVVYPPAELRGSFEPELMLPADIHNNLERRWIKIQNRLN